MKVRQLLEHLASLPPESEVFVSVLLDSSTNTRQGQEILQIGEARAGGLVCILAGFPPGSEPQSSQA